MKLTILILLLIFTIGCYSQEFMTFEVKPLPKFNFINENVNKFCSNQSEYAALSKSAQVFYYWVNYSRAYPRQFFDSVIIPVVKVYPQLTGGNLSSLKKVLYVNSSLPMLKLSPKLNEMAQEFSKDITDHNVNPSHNSTNGDSFVDRFKKNKVAKCGAENISYGQDEPIILLVLLYLDINIPNLGHRTALLNRDFLETGIGSSFYENGSIFLVEDFACSQN